MDCEDLSIIDFVLKDSKTLIYDENQSIDMWKELFLKTSDWKSTADRAFLGGFYGDRISYAFAAGYQSALMHMFGPLLLDDFGALCITEEGGGHPGAVKTTLEKEDSSYKINGRKQFISMVDYAEKIFVAATTGKDENGRNKLKVAVVEKKTTGVEIEQMPDLSFIPEIKHGVVYFKDVIIDEAQILPHDGFVHYVRPFRTVEDIHVMGATIGYFFRTAVLFEWDRSIQEKLIHLYINLRTLSFQDPSSAYTHIALGGLLQFLNSFVEDIEQLWDQTHGDIKKRWHRDKKLLQVAGTIREKRLQKAWSDYEN